MNEHERDFDLEEILKEFGSDTGQALTAGEEETAHSIGGLDTLLSAAEEAPETPVSEPEPEKEAPAEMPELFKLDELEAAAPDALKDFPEEEIPSESGVTPDTIRLDDLSKIAAEDAPAAEPVTGETIRMEPIEIPKSEAATPEEPVIPPEPIPFRPRQQLRELKRDLIAGPEKRYYDLAEAGVGKLQMAMFLYYGRPMR